MTIQQDQFNLLRTINKDSKRSQREMAKDLGVSLGKLNYCLKALKKKGLIKIKNFNQNPNKVNYFYYLTLKGFNEKTRLTINFMRRKLDEYEELKKDLKKK